MSCDPVNIVMAGSFRLPCLPHLTILSRFLHNLCPSSTKLASYQFYLCSAILVRSLFMLLALGQLSGASLSLIGFRCHFAAYVSSLPLVCLPATCIKITLHGDNQCQVSVLFSHRVFPRAMAVVAECAGQQPSLFVYSFQKGLSVSTYRDKNNTYHKCSRLRLP
jgi:hypothetical protein